MRVHFFSNESSAALQLIEDLASRYTNHPWEECETVIVLGGDGTMLRAMHKSLECPKPLYGINYGGVGFLMNPSWGSSTCASEFSNKLENSLPVTLHPLKIIATRKGSPCAHWAFNEVSVIRKGPYAAHLSIDLGAQKAMEKLVADGLLVATPAGSTAYNVSAGGPVLPLGSEVLAITPICPYSPRLWRGAVVPDTSVITVHLLQADKRPTLSVADFVEIKEPDSLEISVDVSRSVSLLFQQEHSLAMRNLRTQFLLR